MENIKELFNANRVVKVPTSIAEWGGDVKAVPSGKLYFNQKSALRKGDTLALALIDGRYIFTKASSGKTYKVSTDRLALSLPKSVFKSIAGEIEEPTFFNIQEVEKGYFTLEKA